MTKLWLPAVTALVTVVSLSAQTTFADITTLQDLQSQTDQLIKVAQADMHSWQKPHVTTSNQQMLDTASGQKAAGAKPASKSTTDKPKANAQSKRHPPRGTRTVPSMGWSKAAPSPKKTS